jgi:phage terminase large subunit-like protein
VSFTDFLKNPEPFTRKAKKEAKAQSPEASSKVRRILDIPFYINKLNHSIDSVSQRWIRSAADERACIEHGCRFSEERGMYVVNWLEENCILYEGDRAGENISVEDWQYEMFMQGYGWLYFDEEWEKRKAGLGWVRRYRVISGWVPKKNTKSPSLAAHGLYNFAGDGELGQKCFSLATTRDQALIAHTHALNFVKQSPKLFNRCKIDATTGEITDKFTNSSYKILCGDKGELKKSKEGINGSLFIDETHVVDGAFMGVVSRAGLSRRQPLRVQLSTAGQDTAGYGFEQYNLGKENIKAAERGLDFNFRFLHFAYEIPQETSIDELRDPANVERFIKLSNPTLGRVVTLSDAKADWMESVRSDTKLIEYAMYRLNQWNTGGGAFIAGSDWERCNKPFTIEEIKDCPMIMAVDLSTIRDMTALVCMFAVPREVKCLVDFTDPDSGWELREINVPHVIPYFWLPRRSLGQYIGRLEVEELARQKHLFITDSPIVKVEVIAEHIAAIAQKFDCRGLAGDMYRTKSLAACLESSHGWDPDSEIHLIPQTNQFMEPAIEALQGCILAQEMVHNNNPILNWQLGNIVIDEDTKHNRRFLKPSKNDWRKIDGWAALLNGFCVMMNDSDLYPGAAFGVTLIGDKDEQQTEELLG